VSTATTPLSIFFFRYPNHDQTDVLKDLAAESPEGNVQWSKLVERLIDTGLTKMEADDLSGN
jgi:hypothetical protein